MSPEQQRISIAEACGVANQWVLKKRGLYYRPHAKGYTNHISEAWIVPEGLADTHTYPHDEPVTKHRAPLPDYLNDLNAMHEAVRVGIKTENEFTDYAARLTVITGDFCPIEATAAQRAEAFLRAIGKWKES